VPSSTIAHVSVSPPLIPDGRLSRVRLAAAACPQRPFPDIPKLKRSPVYAPWMPGYTSGSTPSEVITAPWHCVQTMFPLRCPPLTESPFAACGCYPLAGGVPAPPRRALPLLPRSYGLMRPTTILSRTSASALYPRVFAGSDEPLLEDGGSRRYLRESIPGCLSPSPGGIRGAHARYFPRIIGLPRGPRTGRLNHKRSR
jgi:hypothetical protein